VTNNDILRRIRYIFDFSDSKMTTIFGLADYQVTREQISNWLKKDDDPAYQKCDNTQLAIFLNGLINDKRGKKEGSQPELEEHLTNNIIFMKLKIVIKINQKIIKPFFSLIIASSSSNGTKKGAAHTIDESQIFKMVEKPGSNGWIGNNDAGLLKACQIECFTGSNAGD